jgi:lysyl-tRNA synthetase class 2
VLIITNQPLHLPCHRNEGVSSRHNPEFTSVELYQAYADYTDMMDIAETIIRECASRVCGGTQVRGGR